MTAKMSDEELAELLATRLKRLLDAAGYEGTGVIAGVGECEHLIAGRDIPYDELSSAQRGQLAITVSDVLIGLADQLGVRTDYFLETDSNDGVVSPSSRLAGPGEPPVL